ncbi:hypothetical protein SDJN03_07749, partial [Cucurbita argyrosperma subsp. sororia]
MASPVFSGALWSRNPVNQFQSPSNPRSRKRRALLTASGEISKEASLGLFIPAGLLKLSDRVLSSLLFCLLHWLFQVA